MSTKLLLEAARTKATLAARLLEAPAPKLEQAEALLLEASDAVRRAIVERDGVDRLTARRCAMHLDRECRTCWPEVGR